MKDKTLIKWTPIKESQLDDAQKAYEFAIENYDAVNKLYVDELTSPIKDEKYLAEMLKLVNGWAEDIRFWQKKVCELTDIKLSAQIQFEREEISEEGTEYEKALIQFRNVHKAFIDDLIELHEGTIEIFTGMYSTFRAIGDDEKAWRCTEIISEEMKFVEGFKAEKAVI